MDAIRIGDDETKLLEKVREGKVADLGGARISAELIRRIVLGLPFAGDEEDSIWGDVRRLFGRPVQSCECPRTPVGIWLRNATIADSLDLGSATGEEGGPMCPLTFESCTFEAGFAGAHARFSRLGFKGCHFIDPWPGKPADLPTIELSGAAIDSDLHMTDIRPLGIKADSVRPRNEGNHLWIRLNGARIDGEIDLCGSHLRAPPPRPRRASEAAWDALDLTLAEIKGDIQMVEARCEGRLKMRTAHVAGDVWMTGATFENVPDDAGEHAIQAQGARIDGFLMMNGGFAEFGKSGPYRRFTCHGRLKLEAAEIARSVYLEDAAVRGSIEALHLTVADDLILSADVSGAIDLTGCRIGRSVDLSRLNLACSVKRVSFKDGNIGRALKLASNEVSYRFLKARACRLQGNPPFCLVETLWTSVRDEDEQGQPVPWRRRLVQAAFLLEDVGGWNPRIFHLDGHADAVQRASAAACPQGAVVARRDWDSIRRHYVLDEDLFSQIPTGDRGFENGLVILPECPEADLKRLVTKRDWFAPEPGPSMRPYKPPKAILRRFAHHIEFNPLLQARFDLDGLNCDMLEDRGGRAWGEHWDPISMNHFVYRRTVSTAEPSARRFDPKRNGRLPRRPGVVETRARKSSARVLLDRFDAALADWFWPRMLKSKAERLRGSSDYLETWQVRRNWIYRQFAGPRALNLVSPSRYRIEEQEYSPQPFEQAIIVARAEGREEYALLFEMLKRRIEWRFFNQRIRWPLAGLAITCGAGWLWLHDGSFAPILVALLLTLVMMAIVSSIDDWLRKIAWLWLRRVARELILYIPALVLLLGFDHWWSKPFDFIVAFLIYLGIRFTSVIAHGFMRVGFGYLRRPARAIVTLTVAFLIGWWGVNLANQRDMLVIDAEPVAGVAGPDPLAKYPYDPIDEEGERKIPVLMGSEHVDPGRTFLRELSCAPTLSEPLYALDVLIPLIDLREESRCEIRRVAHHPVAPAAAAGHGPAETSPPPASDMGFWQLLREFPDFLLDDYRFWWWMKALYALAGWFIVSLSLLTFAQVNRTHGEPAEGG